MKYFPESEIAVWISLILLMYLQSNVIVVNFNVKLNYSQKPTSSVSPIYQTSSTKVQPVQPQVLNSVPANQLAAASAKESKQPVITAVVSEPPAPPAPPCDDRAGSPTIGKPALPPKPPPPVCKTTTPPPPPRQNAYHIPHHYHQPDTSPEDGSRAYYTDRPAQQKDLTPPPRIPNGNGPVKSNFGNSIDSSESDNSSSSTSMRSMFGNMK